MAANQTSSTFKQQDLDQRIKLANLVTMGQVAGATAFALFFLGLDCGFPGADEAGVGVITTYRNVFVALFSEGETRHVCRAWP